IVHAAARHGAKGMERGMLLQGAIAVAGVAARDSDYSQLAVGAAAVGANLINQSYSRDAESESDYYGMQYMARAGYDPHAAVDLQETFVRLSEGRDKNWLAGLFASHPPSEARVAANRKTAETLPQGGKLGREIYQRKTAYIRKVQPAYTAYDVGFKALKQKAYTQALQSADKAIDIEPKEALFYGLKGDVYKAQGKHRLALRNYDKAVELNPGYFKHYLQRGEALKLVGDRRKAAQDLERSVELFPTASAYYALGLIASEAGDSRQAVAHFRSAAAGSSDISRAAGAALVKLDLANNPDAYLRASLGAHRGRLAVAVENSTVAAVNDLVIVVRRSDGIERRYRQSRRLPAGQVLRFTTDIPLRDQRQLRHWQARVVEARIAE
ncbi:MAG: M48 family metalloprotease, partial [Chromatiales bacterium]|nr:M48 family metalloprotease [Chromatiales bacterium]